jgi:hypothetical protein
MDVRPMRDGHARHRSHADALRKDRLLRDAYAERIGNAPSALASAIVRETSRRPTAGESKERSLQWPVVPTFVTKNIDLEQVAGSERVGVTDRRLRGTHPIEKRATTVCEQLWTTSRPQD